ncbi:MAG TPA: hypothetical protein VLN61_00155, partial [Pseudolabrys sp.]|nr:hypothetical protein [Pseudolabrys sp.]
DFQLEAFPFRMTALNMAKHRNNPNFAFWKMIKEGYDHFEATHQEPKVAVCEKRYVFDAVPPENASRPPAFNARGQCPAFRLDPTIADAVLEHSRQEQYQMANYIARDVATVPFRVGDGGMNPVFAAKLATHNTLDNNGRVYQVAGNSQAPGALPRAPKPPLVTAESARTSQPVVMASVPMPQPAPQAREGEAPPEKPKSIAGLLGNLFSGSPAQARSTEPAESQTVALRSSNTEMAAKPKRAIPVRTASAPAVPHAKPQDAAPTEPTAVAKNAPAPAPAAQQARKDDKSPAPEMRTAYSSPPPSNNNGLLQGAQPVVPAGSFESRWTALR